MILPFTLPPALLDERGDQLTGILQAYCGVLAQADAATAVRPPRAELADGERGDRGLLLGGVDTVAFAHGVDGVEVHGERGVQRVVGFARVLDARDAEVGRVVARIEHDAGDRLLADRLDELFRERRQLLGDEEGIAASAHVEHAILVQVEFGLEAVVAAKDLHRQPDVTILVTEAGTKGLSAFWAISSLPFSSTTSTVADGAIAAIFSLAPARAGAGSRRAGRRRGRLGGTTWRFQHPAYWK